MPESYIVRFKVVSIECASLKDGQQYIITYHRGDTYRSTPCYFSADGMVDFSPMPEGAAIVHFKTGGSRFHPKWIKFRLEEYIRGHPRRTVGETRVDCAEVLGLRSVTATALRRVTFDLYGVDATMTVALLVCPQSHPTLSFDGLLKTNKPQAKDAGPARSAAPEGETRKMARGEAMALLISLETMLEQRRDKLGKAAESPLERRFAELEERRRLLTSVEGLAAVVVKHRAEEIPAAQFTALSRKYRKNFIGEVAAYLRQMAIASGVSLSNGSLDDLTLSAEAARDRLQRTNARIDSLSQQIRKFEEERSALSRLQGRADSASHLSILLTKIETLQAQLQPLEKSRGVLEGVARGGGALPIAREVGDVRGRTRLLAAESEELREQIRRMMIAANAHVLKWARSKNPPTEDVRKDIASLFADDPGQTKKTHGKKGAAEGEAKAADRQEEIEDFTRGAKEQQPSAPSESASSESEVSKPEQKAEKTKGADGRPLREEPEADRANKANPMRMDAFVSGLSSDMFAPQNPDTKDTTEKGGASNLPPSSNFVTSMHTDPQMPVFDFSSPSKENEVKPEESTSHWDARSGQFDFGAEGSFKVSAVQIDSIYNDPMYDFVSREDPRSSQNANFQMRESRPNASFGDGTGVRAAMDTTQEATLPKQNYNFGPDQDTEGDVRSKDGASFFPTYDFGGDSESQNNRDKFLGGRTYNFGS